MLCSIIKQTDMRCDCTLNAVQELAVYISWRDNWGVALEDVGHDLVRHVCIFTVTLRHSVHRQSQCCKHCDG